MIGSLSLLPRFHIFNLGKLEFAVILPGSQVLLGTSQVVLGPKTQLRASRMRRVPSRGRVLLQLQICIPLLSNLRSVRSSLVIDRFSRDIRYQKDVMSQPRRGCRFSPAPAHDMVSALGRRWPDRLNGIPMKVHLGTICLLVCSVLASRRPAYESKDQDEWNEAQSHLHSIGLRSR